MRSTIEIVDYYASHAPARVAVRSGGTAWTYRQLHDNAVAIARALEREGARVLALAADNHVAWVAADLAAQIAGITLVPLPSYFSAEQTRQALRESGADGVLADGAFSRQLFRVGGESATTLSVTSELFLSKLPRERTEPRLPLATAKVSYTAGTTGNPKGVCLVASPRWTASRSRCGPRPRSSTSPSTCACCRSRRCSRTSRASTRRCATAPRSRCPALRETGLAGSAGLDVRRLVECIAAHRPHSIILLPQTLAALVAAIEAGAPRPDSLRFAAVGGARVPASLLERAERLGLPVYEGYGLTECASVVALNTPAARRAGSVGRVLSHASVRIDERSEIRVSGTALSRYVGDRDAASRRSQPATSAASTPTASCTSRAGARVSSSRLFGRKVSPDWVEAELTRSLPIAQAALFGESRPWNVAVIVPSAQTSRAREIRRGGRRRQLQDRPYARVHDWIRAEEPFTPENGLLTPNGRNRRAAGLESAIEVKSTRATATASRSRRTQVACITCARISSRSANRLRPRRCCRPRRPRARALAGLLRACGIEFGVRNERRQFAVARAAHADAARPTRMALGIRLVVGHVQRVVLRDVEAARSAELRPLLEELAVLIEELDAVVVAVRDEQPAPRVERERMRYEELSGGGARTSPLLQEFAVARELQNPIVRGVLVPVAHEHVAAAARLRRRSGRRSARCRCRRRRLRRASAALCRPRRTW